MPGEGDAEDDGEGNDEEDIGHHEVQHAHRYSPGEYMVTYVVASKSC